MSRLRVAAIIAFAAVYLAIFLPNVAVNVVPMYGRYGIDIDDNNKIDAVLPSYQSKLKLGDVVDFREMPLPVRLGWATSRSCLAGSTLVVPVLRNGRHIRVPLVCKYDKENPSPEWLTAAWEASALLIILMGTALVLVRPTRLTLYFFLYAVTSGLAQSWFWSFLPLGAYLVIFLFCTACVAIYPVSFLMLAVRLPDIAPRRWQDALERAAPYLVCALVASILAWVVLWTVPTQHGSPSLDVLLLIGFQQPFYLLGLISLTVGAVRSWRDNKRALAWACIALAVSGALLVFFFSMSIYNRLVPSQALVDQWIAIFALVVSQVLSIIAIFVVLRNRIVDVRFVVSRTVAFGVIGYAVVVAFALLNWAFVTQLERIAFMIPVEIVIAVWVGFRLSGLQDVAAALDLADTQAPAALARGDPVAELDMLARALARAERTRNPGLIATVRAYAAFGAWFMGQDEEFERHARALEELVGDKSMRGLRRFARSSRGAINDGVPEQREMPEWVARAHLVTCGHADDVLEARRQAALAVEAADASGIPFLRAIARVALAEFSVEERAGLYDAAMACCKEANLMELEQAVLAVSIGKKHLGMLEPFVHKRLRVRRPLRPTLDIRFADASVRAFGQAVELRERELGLLLLVAQAPEGIKSDRAADQLWPELDGDAARNVLRQTLHRLRKALGDNAAVLSSGPSYRLRDGALVDLWEMRAMANSKARLEALSDEEREPFGSAFNALRAGHASRPTEQEWFIPIEREITQLKRDVGRRLAEDELKRGDGQAAGDIARALIEDDPFDEMPRGLAIRAYLAVGDRGSAMYEYNQYVESMAGVSDNPSADLAALVAAARPAN